MFEGNNMGQQMGTKSSIGPLGFFVELAFNLKDPVNQAPPYVFLGGPSTIFFMETHSLGVTKGLEFEYHSPEVSQASSLGVY